ncbi:hypothetical protein E2542_SST22431 [Spatholobus suberectus]|nr:hypothetical protein E2542_SST22431 [Spatholobus suberectus]
MVGFPWWAMVADFCVASVAEAAAVAELKNMVVKIRIQITKSHDFKILIPLNDSDHKTCLLSQTIKAQAANTQQYDHPPPVCYFGKPSVQPQTLIFLLFHLVSLTQPSQYSLSVPALNLFLFLSNSAGPQSLFFLLRHILSSICHNAIHHIYMVDF